MSALTPLTSQTTTTTTAPPPINHEALVPHGNRYFHIPTDVASTSFEDAKAACEDKGLNLASVASDEDKEAVRDFACE